MYENYSNIPFNAISYECNERLLSSESGHSGKMALGLILF